MPIKPRFTTPSGIPKVRTQVDLMGNEINNERKVSNDINRTELVRKKHEAKYGRNKEESKSKNKNAKDKKQN